MSHISPSHCRVLSSLLSHPSLSHTQSHKLQVSQSPADSDRALKLSASSSPSILNHNDSCIITAIGGCVRLGLKMFSRVC